MVEPIKSKVRRSLQAAEGLYHRLVLLVGEPRSGKTEVLHDIAAGLGTNVTNVNLALSRELLELTARQRALHLLEILDRLLGATQPTVVLDNLEILFGKEMKQDSLRVLQGISRNRWVVASWNGAIKEGKLIYAEIGHPEYRSYDVADTLIVSMEGMATLDSEKNHRK